jgi:hypothetical protein
MPPCLSISSLRITQLTFRNPGLLQKLSL